jgi:hypothetical protein
MMLCPKLDSAIYSFSSGIWSSSSACCVCACSSSSCATSLRSPLLHLLVQVYIRQQIADTIRNSRCSRILPISISIWQVVYSGVDRAKNFCCRYRLPLYPLLPTLFFLYSLAWSMNASSCISTVGDSVPSKGMLMHGKP